jgi:hypothetical protein
VARKLYLCLPATVRSLGQINDIDSVELINHLFRLGLTLK